MSETHDMRGPGAQTGAHKVGEVLPTVGEQRHARVLQVKMPHNDNFTTIIYAYDSSILGRLSTRLP